MWSKNKSRPTAQARKHAERLASMPCGVCGAPGPSEVHEIRQGQFFTSIPLCADCHRGSHNGIHGQKRIWNVRKLDELAVLNSVIESLETA